MARAKGCRSIVATDDKLEAPPNNIYSRSPGNDSRSAGVHLVK